MENKIFFVDKNQELTYSNLLNDLNNFNSLPKVINEKDIYKIFLNLIISILYQKEIILLDSDLSENEIDKLRVREDFNVSYELLKKKVTINDLKNLHLEIGKSNWKLTLFSSGTTGIPKRVNHTLSTLTKFLRVNDKRSEDIWGFAYNPTHIAGIQVFFQAFFNLNTIINLFGLSPVDIKELISKYKINSISATPTFYNLLLSELKEEKFDFVKNLTFGGEKFLPELSNRIQKFFPLARLKNIYASTEAGSLFTSNGECFEIMEEFKDLIKFENNELVLHKSLVANIDNINNNQEWYYTGDMVEFVSENPIKFKFISRKSDIINIGGYNVSPYEVEEVICSYPNIVGARVYGIKNKLTQNIIAADVVAKELVSEDELRKYLSNKLQSYKVPRIIRFVENLELTRTGKIKRQ